MQTRYQGALLGLACAEALGLQVEHLVPGTFPRVDDMTGGGPFQLLPGQWGAATAMALCLSESLLHGGFEVGRQMAAYRRWWRRGYMSCTGRCFGAAAETIKAIEYAEHNDQAVCGSHDIFAAGNDCLARLAPVVLYFYHLPRQLPELAERSALTTHAALESVECSRLFACMLLRALQGADKEAILSTEQKTVFCSLDVNHVSNGDYRSKPVAAISANRFAPESLEAALWCFANTDSYADAVLVAVNLGGSAGATAAICGQLAGAFYGVDAIPAQWLAKLAWREKIQALSDALYHHHQGNQHVQLQLAELDLHDARDRFAVIAAARSVSSDYCRIRTSEAEVLLQASGIRDLLRQPQRVPNADVLDQQHRMWCRAVIRLAAERGLDFCHGTAARLINTYLQLALVLPQQASGSFIEAMHPPLTRQLLDFLNDHCGYRDESIQTALNSGMDEAAYEAVITRLRGIMGGQGLWRLACMAAG